jgi:hypothetical protein
MGHEIPYSARLFLLLAFFLSLQLLLLFLQTEHTKVNGVSNMIVIHLTHSEHYDKGRHQSGWPLLF